MAQNQTKQADVIAREVTVPPYLRMSKIIAYVLYAWITIGVVLLSLRVFLLLFSANVATPFVQFVYRTSGDYLQPFRGIFESRQVGETGYFDVAAIFAIIMYLLAGWAIGALVSYIQHKIDLSTLEQKERLQNQLQSTPPQQARKSSLEK